MDSSRDFARLSLDDEATYAIVFHYFKLEPYSLGASIGFPKDDLINIKISF